MLLSVPDNSAAALVVLPLLTDSTLAASSVFEIGIVSNMLVELFNRSGLAGSTSLIVDTRQLALEGCLSWPQARLAEVPPRPWRVGFAKDIAVPLPLDSLEAMSSADSSLITREIARLSSALAEGDDPAFGGLPFVVRKAYRFSLSTTSVVAADVVRKINEEANPREEHLLLVAERPLSVNSTYSAVFHSRVAGSEDAVRTNEILGAIRFVKTNATVIVVSFEYEDGGRIALLQRTSDRSWTTRWRSAYTGC